MGWKATDECHKHGISEATIYNCKSRNSGRAVSEAKWLRVREGDTAKQKRCWRVRRFGYRRLLIFLREGFAGNHKHRSGSIARND